MGLIPIEESYVTRKVPEFEHAAAGGYLVNMCNKSTPADMVHNGAVRMHLSLSGLDYYGADIGGLHRSGVAYRGACCNRRPESTSC